MIMICKHCNDILGYDNNYTKRDINQECEHCKKGLRQTDVIFADDLMVPLLLKLNRDLGIKTYYSCIGHIDRGEVKPTYIVVEDSEEAKYIFGEILVLNWSSGTMKKDGKNKIRVQFNENTSNNIYEHNSGKADLMKFVCKMIDSITKREEYLEIKKENI